MPARGHRWVRRQNYRPFGRTRIIVPLVVSGLYAVGSPMAALGAHVSAKLRCAVAWVRLHRLYYHRLRAHGAKGGRHGRQSLFCSHMISFSRNGSRPMFRGPTSACHDISTTRLAPSKRSYACHLLETAAVLQ